jgi:hypothetical protein
MTKSTNSADSNQNLTGSEDRSEATMPDDIAQNPGMRAAAINSDPTLSLQETRNAAAGEAPNAAGSVAPSTAEDNVPGTSDPYPSNIPSTDHPLPDDDDEETQGDSKSFSDEADNRYVH